MRIETFENMLIDHGGNLVETQNARGGAAFHYGKTVAQSFKNAGGAAPIFSESDWRNLPPVYAFVSAGRWVVECPDCTYAIRFCEAMPHFICPIHEQWRRVELPDERDAIEAELVVRPVHPILGLWKSNWKPGETVDDLKAENAAHVDEIEAG